jgi:hypothetical protein
LCIAAISLLTMLATGVVAAREAGGAAQSGSLAAIQVFHERQLNSPASERGAVRGLSAAWRPTRRPRDGAGRSVKRLQAFEVDCAAVRNKQALMTALAAGLDFPDYFGANWDALADCLTDFG